MDYWILQRFIYKYVTASILVLAFNARESLVQGIHLIEENTCVRFRKIRASHPSQSLTDGYVKFATDIRRYIAAYTSYEGEIQFPNTNVSPKFATL